MWASTLASAACASANRGSRRIASRKNSAAERCSVVFSRRMSCRPRRKNSCAARFSVPRRSSRAASPSSSVRRNARTVARAISSWIAKMSWSSRSNVSDQSSAPSAATSWRGDTHALARLAHAAVEHRAHREQPRDLAVVYGAVLELEGSGAGCDAQPAHPGERIDDLLGGALAEIPLVAAWTHVGEREHRDGWVGRRRQLGGRWRARSLDRHRRLAHGGAKSACGPLPAPKPHATASATKKPTITNTMMNRSAQSGRPSGTSIVETTCTSSQPAAAYASATRATRPDPSVCQRILYRDSDSPMGNGLSTPALL